MQVYPAAGLIGFAEEDIPIYYVDPKPSLNFELRMRPKLKVIAEKASSGVPKIVEELMK
jgi:NAD-dependent deacetylase